LGVAVPQQDPQDAGLASWAISGAHQVKGRLREPVGSWRGQAALGVPKVLKGAPWGADLPRQGVQLTPSLFFSAVFDTEL